MPASDLLVITGLTVVEKDGKITFSADELVTKSMFAGQTVKEISGEIIDGKAMFSMTVMMAMGETPKAYPCKYNGAIKVEEGSYVVPE